MSFGYYRPVTTDHSKNGSTDETDYPFGFIGTYADLAQVSSGGYCRSDGLDISPFADIGAATIRDYELVCFNAATGFIEMYWRVPTSHHSTDDVDYLFFGDPSATDRSNPHGVWSSDHSSVHHFGDGGSVGTIDSTANGNTLTNVGATATTGLVGGGAINLDGSSHYLYAPHASNMDATTALTASIAIKISNTSNQQVFTRDDSSGRSWGIYTTNFMGGSVFKTGDAETNMNSSTNVCDNTLHLLHLRYQYVSDGGSTLKYSVDGSTVATSTSAVGQLHVTSTQLDIGRRSYHPFEAYTTGNLDEARVSLAYRSDDRVLREANNLLSPSTYYSVGSRVANGTTLSLAGTARVSVRLIGSAATTLALAGFARSTVRAIGSMTTSLALAGTTRTSARLTGQLGTTANLGGQVRAGIRMIGQAGTTLALTGVTRTAPRLTGAGATVLGLAGTLRTSVRLPGGVITSSLALGGSIRLLPRLSGGVVTSSLTLGGTVRVLVRLTASSVPTATLGGTIRAWPVLSGGVVTQSLDLRGAAIAMPRLPGAALLSALALDGRALTIVRLPGAKFESALPLRGVVATLARLRGLATTHEGPLITYKASRLYDVALRASMLSSVAIATSTLSSVSVDPE